MHRTFVFGTFLFLALAARVDGTSAQSSSDIEAIKAANSGFYTALSARDAGALDRMWDHDGQVFNIFGVSKAPMVGWNAIKSGYADLFNRFPELSVAGRLRGSQPQRDPAHRSAADALDAGQ